MSSPISSAVYLELLGKNSGAKGLVSYLLMSCLFRNLQNLTEIRAGENNLTCLPEEIGKN